MKRLLALLIVLMVPTFVSAQTPPIKNPRAVGFTSADHALVDRYEIDVVRLDGTVVQTITVQKADTTVVNGEVQVSLNVQPIAFGEYTFRARAVAGTVKSDTSVPSDPWERAPGQPSKPVAK